MDAPLALAFTAGMVATVNPCGFAMLPAYLSYFLGLEATPGGDGEPPTAGVARALRGQYGHAVLDGEGNRILTL